MMVNPAAKMLPGIVALRAEYAQALGKLHRGGAGRNRRRHVGVQRLLAVVVPLYRAWPGLEQQPLSQSWAQHYAALLHKLTLALSVEYNVPALSRILSDDILQLAGDMPIRLEDGRCTSLLGYAADCQERRTKEEALHLLVAASATTQPPGRVR